MSNALRKKKKKMQPLGYNKQELTGIYNYSRNKSAMDNITYKAFMDVRLISYLILHDKFGFGQKRIVRLENTVDTYRNNAEKEPNLTGRALAHFLKETSDIDIRNEVNVVPYRECTSLAERNTPETGKIILAVLYNYFALSCTALKTVFKFSANKLKEYMNWIRYYINTLSRRKQFEVTVKDIAEVLMDECKYCDARFVS